mmetsp:Transcript_5261/g.11532  ORF Transcript_5261/g.11532 Transcript_5261/m.11532 type:complete len:221 (+) Transcript_5261:2143-2805(+)
MGGKDKGIHRPVQAHHLVDAHVLAHDLEVWQCRIQIRVLLLGDLELIMQVVVEDRHDGITPVGEVEGGGVDVEADVIIAAELLHVGLQQLPPALAVLQLEHRHKGVLPAAWQVDGCPDEWVQHVHIQGLGHDLHLVTRYALSCQLICKPGAGGPHLIQLVPALLHPLLMHSVHLKHVATNQVAACVAWWPHPLAQMAEILVVDDDITRSIAGQLPQTCNA